MLLVVARAHVDGANLLLALADHEDEVVLGQLRIADLLVEGRARVQVQVHRKAGIVQRLLQPMCIVVELRVEL